MKEKDRKTYKNMMSIYNAKNLSIIVEEEVSDESFEELDLMGSADEEEGGLEFDLEDFMEDMDEYFRCLDIIADTNHIETIEPEDAEDNVVEDNE